MTNQISGSLETQEHYAGLVRKNHFTMSHYTTVGGKSIKELAVGWESYGKINSDKSNVILVPHFYSGNSHVAGRYQADEPLPGYWDSIIGPGKPLDTEHFCIISIDSLVNLNSKDGVTVTTGPASMNPDSGKPYGMNFPVLTIRDFVRVQKALLDALGIGKLHAAVGVSMGALQSYEWAAAYPQMVERVIAVNGTPSQRPYAMCALAGWTEPIKGDPHWNHGNYYAGPEPLAGLMQAFYNVFVGAHHPDFVAANFQYQWADAAQDPLDGIAHDFAVNKTFMDASRLRASKTDANTMLYMTRANQLFFAGSRGSSVAPGLTNIRAKTLVVHAHSDLLFPIEQAREQCALLQENGTQAAFVMLDAASGHISGVTEIAKAGAAIRKFLAEES